MIKGYLTIPLISGTHHMSTDLRGKFFLMSLSPGELYEPYVMPNLGWGHMATGNSRPSVSPP